ncbi:uncharacterized protein LOC113465054 [Ceratina calcarata]|uniref:Uncharacterized protein LOC113465054 n=1 Tax=Ceratina calcarata TaxID=156304 RepID=A0AAJ7WF64_9HYME|nr:uncharacterized protein LOC113465054 [Ceratina calcarata]
MEIIELAEKKKAFAPPEERYRNPHKEAIRVRQIRIIIPKLDSYRKRFKKLLRNISIQLKVLWSAHKPLSKRKELLEARHLYRDASNLLKTDAKLEIITRLVSKALLFDCHYHPLYALKGDIYMRKGNWKNAITSYESAKLMAMQDENLSRNDQKMMYNERLIDAHKERGDWYWKNDHLLEASNDYEHVLLFRLPGMNIPSVQVHF